MARFAIGGKCLHMTRPVLFTASGLLVLLALVLVHRPMPLFAQSADKVKDGLRIWQTSGCADCHGPFADGNPADDDYPIGANLRTAKIDVEALILTIRCGRPGTGMPAFDAESYRTRACYGRPLGTAPDNLQPSPSSLSLDEIDALVAYLRTRIIGRGRITKEECLTYYDGRADECVDFQ
jgi:mono/diheme cytochrome c family protein